MTSKQENVLAEVVDLPAIAESWRWVHLGEVAKVTKLAGFEFTKYVDYDPDGDLPVIKAENVSKSGFINTTFSRVRSKSVARLTRSRLEADDVLMVFVGSIGQVARVPAGQQFFLGPNVAVIKLESSRVLSAYVECFLRSPMIQQHIRSLSKATTQPSISMGQIRLIPVAVCPENEQHRIVEEIEKQFSRLDEAVANLKRVQANLKRYRASVLQAACEGRLVPTEAELARNEDREYEPADQLLQRILIERRRKWEENELAKMCEKGKEPTDDKWKSRYKGPVAPDMNGLSELPEGWEWASFDSVCHIVSGCAFDSKDFATTGVPAIKIANIGYGKFDWKQQEYLPHSFAPKYDGYLVKPHSVLFALTRPITNNTVKACTYPSDAPDGLLNQRVAMLQPHSGYSSAFLLYIMRSEFFKRQVQSNTSETLQPNLSPLSLKGFALPVPPLAEQERIVAEIDRRLSVIDQMEATVETGLKRAERLRQAILKRAFEGKLVSQGPNDEPAGAISGCSSS